MDGMISGVVAATLLIFLGICVVYTPYFIFSSYMGKRDCELIHQKQCVWSISPVIEVEDV